MRSCFLRAVLLSATAVGIILVPALPAQAQCTHLGQQVVCPSGVSDGSMSLSFTNGAIIWQTPTGSTTSSPKAGCCPLFTTPAAPATGLTPTTAAGQNALSNAVRTPSGAVVSDEALREAGARLAQAESRASMAYENQRQRALQAEREARASEEAAEASRQLAESYERRAREAAESVPGDQEAAGRLYEEARVAESMGYFLLASSNRSDAERLEHRAKNTAEAAVRARAGVEEAESRARVARGRAADEHRLAEEARHRQQVALRRAQEGGSEADVAEAERVLTERDWRRLAEKLYSSPEVSESLAAGTLTAEPQVQLAEQAQPAQPVQQAQQFTVYFSDYATGRVYLRGYMEARPVINQSDAANARPPAPRLP